MAEKEYIERGAAIESIRLTYCKECNSYNGVRCRACEFDDAMSMIEDAPAADVVEVRHGEWIKRGNEKKCSVCGFIYYSNNDDWNGCPERELTARIVVVWNGLLDIIERRDAEIERKDRMLESYALQYGTAADKDVFIRKAKAEAIKEFAKKLKEEGCFYDSMEAFESIDNLVKEMTEESK